MLDRDRNTQGFTLAELLLAIAIVLVLAALAAPSISNIQRNMRMLELDAAASDIAVTAQQQMTSMKVSGTWLALFDGDSPQLPTGDQNVLNVPSGVVDNHPEQNDLYYMTADQARTAGIIPAGSIDAAVRNGDYLIEYSLSTVTVFGVFYTDGRTGFFQTAPADIGETKPAQAYYASMTSEVGRIQDARIKADPMIGYFGGTPAGATNEVALANPNIWVDEDGMLCIQDANLSKHPEWLTSLEVYFENQEDGSTATLAFAGLQGDTYTGTYLAGVNLDQENLSLYDNDDNTALYVVVNRDDAIAVDQGADVYRFNLDMLKSSSDVNLKALGGGFTYGDSVKVTATVRTGQKPFVPTDSTAYIKWPEPITKLSVVVTDPANPEGEAGGSHITGTYAPPEVKAQPKSGKPLVLDNMKPCTEEHEIAGTDAALTDVDDGKPGNTEAAYQRYSGSSISVDQAILDEVSIEASVGSYTSSKRNVHYYQIHELWIGVGSDPQTSRKERIGYLIDNKWQWTGSGSTLASSVGVTRNGENVPLNDGDGTSGIMTLNIDPVALKQAQSDLGIGDQTLTLYVRTAPSVDEARVFFTGKESVYGGSGQGGLIPTIIAQMADNLATGARGVNHGAVFRAAFEGEFGCASSVAMWSIARKTESGQYSYDNKAFPTDKRDIRIYYAITPGYGFDGNLSAKDNESTNTALWYFSRAEDVVYPQAMVNNHGDGSKYGNYLVSTKDGRNVVADFEFRYDQDYLFYRLLKYYVMTEADGDYSAASTVPQYVPFSLQDDEQVAEIEAADPIKDDSGKLTKLFSHWTTDETRPESVGSIAVEAGTLLGQYHDQLSYVGTSLYAEYVDAGIGMMYLEFGAKEDGNQVMGYSGYLTSSQSKIESLLENDAAIQSWGYYVLVPTAMNAPQAPKVSGNDMSVATIAKAVTIKGVQYQAYQVTARGNAAKARNLTGAFTLPILGNQKYQYTINANFACAVESSEVAQEEKKADTWGDSESNPWQVRHATQFIGTLSLLDKVQASYVGDCFLQTHTIDMKDTSDPALRVSLKLDHEFSGIYDGGSDKGNSIRNIQYCLWSYYVVNGGDTALGRGSGMFPKVVGTEKKHAEIKNMKVEIKCSDFVDDSYTWDTLSPFSHAGILVGYMSNCTMSNCVIEGDSAVKDGKKVSPSIDIAFGTDSIRGWGALFGGATMSEVSNCAVKSINFTASRKNGGVWNSNPKIGALGGQAIDTTIRDCKVDDVNIGTGSKTNTIFRDDRGVMSVGALIGDISGEKSSCSSVEANNVSMQVANEQYDAKWERGLFYGGLAGTSTIEFDATCTFSGITLKVGSDTVYDVLEAAKKTARDAVASSDKEPDQEGEGAVAESGGSSSKEEEPAVFQDAEPEDNAAEPPGEAVVQQ